MSLGVCAQRRQRRDSLRRLLLATVNRDRTDHDVTRLLRHVDVDAVVRLARRHRVATLLHHRLQGLDAPEAAKLVAELRSDRLHMHALHLQGHATIARLHSVLPVPFLVVKGAALAQRWYDDPSLRTYVDVDVLVRRAEFRAASQALTDAGFTHLLPSWDGLLAQGMAEVPLGHQSSTVDLHWHLISRRRPRHEITLDEDDLFDRADTVRIGSVDVATLDREDTLLHLCIHSGLDGGRRLYQLVDVDRVLRSGRIDWDTFTARAHRAGAHGLCAAIIQRCRQLIGTPVPNTLLARLQPFAGWNSLNARIDRHPRADRHVFDGITSGIVVASGRATRTATIANVARAAWDASAERLAHVGRGGRRPGAAPTRLDDPHSRRRYLAWVDAQAAVPPPPVPAIAVPRRPG